MSESRRILWTAFEPSGDDLTAAVIAGLVNRRPDWRHFAMAGPKTERAGASMVEVSTLRPVMGLDSLWEVGRHLARLKRLKRWLKEHPIDLLVAVDSPSANGSVCALVRKLQPQCRIAHLVAPQYWAWGPWRIRKLRRRTDHVMCLLPFEPEWFGRRGVRATFVGHPATARTYWPEVDPQVVDGLPRGTVKLAILPGSRRSEIEKNGPLMFEAFNRLRSRHPGIAGAVAAFDMELGRRLQVIGERVCGGPLKRYGIKIVVGRVGEVLTWSDVAMVTSGTATLHAAVHQVPMVVIYRLNRLSWWLVARWIIRTRRFAIPNLVNPDALPVVTELVPYFGRIRDLVEAVDPLIRGQAVRESMRQRLAEVCLGLRGDGFQSAVEGVLAGLLEADGLEDASPEAINVEKIPTPDAER
ncbi:MAG: hypothetical protein JJU36_07795 [Phycisphaeraceae bacterium]|nr:hypothetical protein [Phycisphaeraceae bacterium]